MRSAVEVIYRRLKIAYGEHIKILLLELFAAIYEKMPAFLGSEDF
jgi:hypothetical protein